MFTLSRPRECRVYQKLQWDSSPHQASTSLPAMSSSTSQQDRSGNVSKCPHSQTLSLSKVLKPDMRLQSATDLAEAMQRVDNMSHRPRGETILLHLLMPLSVISKAKKAARASACARSLCAAQSPLWPTVASWPVTAKRHTVTETEGLCGVHARQR